MEEKCSYRAPLFAIRQGEKAHITQGTCNHWDCPRCGQIRAREEYGRIVAGCKEMAKDNEIWFLTITCQGADLTLAEAESHYLEWTNRFLSNARYRAKRENQTWSYVQVTERQKRGFPHSHILTTFRITDARLDWKANWVTRDGVKVNEWQGAYRSDWMQSAVIKAGLGEQYDVSVVHTVDAASRYVAKYLFKESLHTQWPKGWKRVRYSQNWPKLPRQKTDAIPLLDNWAIVKIALEMNTLYTSEKGVQDMILHAYQLAPSDYDIAKVVLVGD